MIKSTLRRIIQWAMIEEYQPNIKSSPMLLGPAEKDISSTKNRLSMNFYPAIGGKVVEFWHYDSKEQRQSKIYVISDNEDMHEQLAKIISIEMIQL